MTTTRPCQWVDDDGTACEARASRKYCQHHKDAAKARNAANYRARQADQNRAKQTDSPDAPWYIPESNTREYYARELAKKGRELTQDGRVIPKRREQTEISDGRVQKQSIYDQGPRSSAPAHVRQDAVKRAEWEAREQGLIVDDSEDVDFERIAEVGEEQYRRELQQRQMERDNPAPHVYSFFMQTPWRQHDPRLRVYQDPYEPECVDGSFLRR
jgi:hypothetical protein